MEPGFRGWRGGWVKWWQKGKNHRDCLGQSPGTQLGGGGEGKGLPARLPGLGLQKLRCGKATQENRKLGRGLKDRRILNSSELRRWETFTVHRKVLDSLFHVRLLQDPQQQGLLWSLTHKWGWELGFPRSPSRSSVTSRSSWLQCWGAGGRVTRHAEGKPRKVVSLPPRGTPGMGSDAKGCKVRRTRTPTHACQTPWCWGHCPISEARSRNIGKHLRPLPSGNCRTREISTQNQTHKKPHKYSVLVLLGQQEGLLWKKKFGYKENMNFYHRALIPIRKQIINIMPLAYKLCLSREHSVESKFYKGKSPRPNGQIDFLTFQQKIYHLGLVRGLDHQWMRHDSGYTAYELLVSGVNCRVGLQVGSSIPHLVPHQ